MLTEKKAERLDYLLQRILERHPEADRDTVWRFLCDLELPPIERLRKVLRLGPYAISRRLS